MLTLHINFNVHIVNKASLSKIFQKLIFQNYIYALCPNRFNLNGGCRVCTLQNLLHIKCNLRITDIINIYKLFFLFFGTPSAVFLLNQNTVKLLKIKLNKCSAVLSIFHS